MPRESLKNKTPSELREIKVKNEAKIKYMENKIKYLESQEKQITRKERTHRLCTRGAMLEKYLSEFTDEQVETILKIAFHTEAVGRAIEHFRESDENTTLLKCAIIHRCGAIAISSKFSEHSSADYIRQGKTLRYFVAILIKYFLFLSKIIH